MSAFILAAVKQKLILNFLHKCTFGTQAVRKQSVRINTIKIDKRRKYEELRSVKCCVLEAGAGATTPVNKADGIHRQETDQSENSMGGSL